MLGKARDPRCRLLSISLHVANLHVGQHWRSDPRSRWNTVMSSRFSVSGAGVTQQHQTGVPANTELC